MNGDGLAKEIPVRLETKDGETVFVCENLDEFWAAWKAMTEGFWLCRENDRIWVPPRDVLIDKDGQFIFQQRGVKNGQNSVH